MYTYEVEISSDLARRSQVVLDSDRALSFNSLISTALVEYLERRERGRAIASSEDATVRLYQEVA